MIMIFLLLIAFAFVTWVYKSRNEAPTLVAKNLAAKLSSGLSRASDHCKSIVGNPDSNDNKAQEQSTSLDDAWNIV